MPETEPEPARSPEPSPALSVVLTVVDGADRVAEWLTAFAAQEDAPSLEVIVPYDATCAAVGGLAEAFPRVRFLDMGAVATLHPPDGPAGQHELFDRRRAAGLRVVSAPLVALLEDRCTPRADWARTAVAAHERLGHAVIGGGVVNGADRALNWALFFCDYSRYQPPFPEGPADWITDVNICYRRDALESTRELWEERYHETTVHWAIQRAGGVLTLTPDLVVEHRRDDLRLAGVIRERIAWGRLFAYTRARETGTGKRLVLAALSPILPLVLFQRHARMLWVKRVTFGKFVKASPAVLLMLCCWSFGEFLGYLSGRP